MVLGRGLGVSLVLTAAAVVACGSSGNVGLGGACYTATDCASGLYCFFPPMASAGTNGTCSNNSGKAQPDAMAPLDGGVLDAHLPGTDATPPPAETGPTDSPPPPIDSKPPPKDTGPADLGAPPKDSGGGA